jgi:hypothetical protein
MRLIRSNKGTAAVPLTGTRGSVILDNRKRTDRLIITVRGEVQVAGGPAGATRNGGRIESILSHAVNENGEDTYGLARAWLIRQLSEFDAGQPLAAQVLPASANLPIGVYPVFSQYAIDFASRRLIAPMETAFMERDPSSFLQLDTQITPGLNPVTTLVAPNAGATVTINSLTVTVEQEFAELAGATYPIYKPRFREQSENINGINPQALLYIKTQQRLRRMIIGAEVTVADGGVLITDDVVGALRLMGDGGQYVIGPNQTPFDVLVESQRFLTGGDTTFEGVSFTKDFAQHGRLANTIKPDVQFPNFRYEAAVAPSAIAGSSRVVYGLEELTRPNAANNWAVVSPTLPEWAATLGE